MLNSVKKWFEEVSQMKTNKEDWGIETVNLSKEELDEQLLPEGIKDQLPSTLSIIYYYYSYMAIYEIVYVLPLVSLNKYLVGWLSENKLKASQEIALEDKAKFDKEITE